MQRSLLALAKQLSAAMGQRPRKDTLGISCGTGLTPQTDLTSMLEIVNSALLSRKSLLSVKLRLRMQTERFRRKNSVYSNTAVKVKTKKLTGNVILSLTTKLNTTYWMIIFRKQFSWIRRYCDSQVKVAVYQPTVTLQEIWNSLSLNSNNS